MKTLFVLRHAKSSWEYPELSDFERPLNKRGKKAAPFMGEFMNKKDFIPDLIVSSPAERAKQTAFLIKEAAGFDAEVKFDQRIYEAGSQSLFYVVSEIKDEFKTAMIVGHNPGFENLVGILGGEYQRIPTAALAVIDLNIQGWKDISADNGNLRGVFRPKEQMKLLNKD